MCEYCEESAFNILIENNYTEYAMNVFGNVHIWDEPQEEDMSVVFDMRCGHGYIRVGDRSEMGCIDHSENIEVNYCPMCGRKLGE